MTTLFLASVLAIGCMMMQDGVASILYYPNEDGRNHFARWMRIAGGLFLTVTALVFLIRG